MRILPALRVMVMAAALVPAVGSARVAAAAGGLKVAVSAADAEPVLGVQVQTGLRIEVTGDGPATVAPPRVLASVGRVDGLARVDGRTFSARYLFPVERYPQAAIIVAELPEGGGRGFTVVRLHAAVRPGFHTDAGASVTLRVGDRVFGPETADRQGQVRVSVVVPPGVSQAVARSVNERGQATEQTVELDPPLYPRVLVLRPEAIPAGAVTEIAVFAVDPSGFPAESGTILLQCSCGRPQPLGGDPGQNRFLIRAPSSISDGRLFVTAILRGQPETETEVGVPLVPARAAELALHPEGAHLVVGSGRDMRVFVTAQDAFGNAARLDNVELFVDGTAAERRTLPDGRIAAVVPAPDRWAGRGRVEVEAVLDGSYARQEVSVVSAAAARAEAAAAAEPLLTVAPRLGVLWNLHQTPGAALTVQALRRSPWTAAVAFGASVGYLRGGGATSDGLGVSDLVLDELPVLAVVRGGLRPLRRLETALELGAGVLLAHGRLRSQGQTVAGNGLGLGLQAGAEVGLRLRGGCLLLGARYLHAHLGALSSGDEIDGNSAGLVLDAGYRIGF